MRKFAAVFVGSVTGLFYVEVLRVLLSTCVEVLAGTPTPVVRSLLLDYAETDQGGSVLLCLLAAFIIATIVWRGRRMIARIPIYAVGAALMELLALCILVAIHWMWSIYALHKTEDILVFMLFISLFLLILGIVVCMAIACLMSEMIDHNEGSY